MKSIKESFLFDMLDKSASIKDKMKKYDPILDDVGIQELEEPLNTIKRRFNYPAKNVIFNELGVFIKPVLNKDRIKLPTSLPAYLMVNPRPTRDDDRVIAVVNLTNYGRKVKSDNTSEIIDIEPKQLFGLLQTGEVLLTCNRKWNSITMSQDICKLGSLIYSRMFVKVLDKMFAVNFDPIKADKIKFVASKFFLLNMLEKSANSESINNMAYLNCTNGTTRNTINQFDEEFGMAAYKNFGNLIQQLQLNINGLGSLTVRTFIDTACKMYHPSTTLAFDYFPFFLHAVFSVVIGARMNSEFVLESVFGKEADKLYNTFVGFMR